MKQIVKNLLLKLSADLRFQRFLERNVSFSQSLMGIGSGGYTEVSGETALVDLLWQDHSLGRPLCLFDVGANQGQFLEMMQSGLKGMPFQVHCFEPASGTFSILANKARVYSNVTLNHCGLGRQAGEMILHFDEPGSGMASLYARDLEHLGVRLSTTETVRLDTLDAYCQRHAIEVIDLLKMDVEGHELEVVNGGVEMFQQRKIRRIMFEFGGCNLDSRTLLRDFLNFFSAHGMTQVFRITPAKALVPVGRYHEGLEQYKTTNYLVVQDSVHSKSV